MGREEEEGRKVTCGGGTEEMEGKMWSERWRKGRTERARENGSEGGREELVKGGTQGRDGGLKRGEGRVGTCQTTRITNNNKKQK